MELTFSRGEIDDLSLDLDRFYIYITFVTYVSLNIFNKSTCTMPIYNVSGGDKKGDIAIECQGKLL